MKIPTTIIDLSKVFFENNYKLFVVGGAVRDHVIGIEPKDYDLATDALPEQIIEILTKANYKFDSRGEKFGVIVAFGNKLPKEGVEIATFREDLTKGRHPDVKVGSTIEADVLRRDTTINALFYNIETDEIVDLVNGLNDIYNKTIRMVGNPYDRILEDQLRVQRVARFSVTFNFKIDSETKDAIIKNADLSDISKERVFDEIIKADSKVKNLYTYFSLLDELNVLNKIFFKARDLKKPTLCLSKNLYLIVSGMLINENPKDIERILVHDYKFSTEIARRVSFLLSLKSVDPINILSFFRKKEELKIEDEILVSWLKLANKENLKFINFKPVHNTEDLISKGYSGKRLGDKIKEIEKENYEKLK